MKIVTVPADIKVSITTAKGKIEEPITFKRFLIHQLDTYEGFKTREQVRQAEKLVRVITESGDRISFEDADFAALDAACNEIRWIPEVKRRLLPFVDAIEKVETSVLAAV